MSISIYIFDLQVTRVKSEKRNAKTFIMVMLQIKYVQILCFVIITLWKESLNNDGQQFYEKQPFT
jgi:hypothetical protein